MTDELSSMGMFPGPVWAIVEFVKAGRRGATVLVIVVGMAIASAAVAAPPARDAYIKRVDPICKKTDDRLHPIGKKFARKLKDGKSDQAAQLLFKMSRIYSASLRRLGHVQPPAADRRQIAHWLRLEHRDVRITLRSAAFLKREEFRSYNHEIRKSGQIEHEIDSVIGNYGFKRCN